MSLIIYTKPGCPYCEKARSYFSEIGEPFEDLDAQNNAGHRAAMLEISGGNIVVPCIVRNGEYIQSGWGEPPRG